MLPIFSRYLLAVALLAMGASFANAQEAAPATEATTTAPQAIALLSQSAQTIESAAGATVELVSVSRMVRGEEDESAAHHFRYAKAAGGNFSMTTHDAEGNELAEGIVVRGNGAITMTWVPSISRHQLEESTEGISSFIKSGMASGIANGLGSLVFGFLTTDTIDELKSQLTSAEYVGQENLDGTPAHHCRYVIGGDLTFDAWYSTDANPAILRVQPDLSEMAKASPAAQQFENFSYTVIFDFKGWNLNAEFAPGAFRYDEPAGSELVLSIMQQQNQAIHPMLGKPAPDFELLNLEGETVKLSDHFGKDVVLLDFWATWCPPCVAALPVLDSVTSQYADQGVVFYAVDQGEDAETVTAFLESKGLSPAVLLDNAQPAVSDAYGVRGLPTSILIGKDGKVQVVHVGFGPSAAAHLAGELEALIAEKDLAGDIVAKQAAQTAVKQAKLNVLREQLKAGN